MSTAITDLPNVQALAEKFDLVAPPGFRGVITDWSFVPSEIDGGAILIKEIQIYNTDGDLVKAADLSILQKNIHLFSHTFKKQSNG